MNYEQMSDFEINKAVAESLGMEPYQLGNGHWVTFVGGTENNRMPDYCNNPADAWPVIVENGISIQYVPDGSERYVCYKGQHGSGGNNPLRAAMIVFLMMKEGDE